MSRTVEVPEGCKAVFVTDQMVERYADWMLVGTCELKATSLDGGPVGPSDLVIDVQSRYVALQRSWAGRANL